MDCLCATYRLADLDNAAHSPVARVGSNWYRFVMRKALPPAAPGEHNLAEAATAKAMTPLPNFAARRQHIVEGMIASAIASRLDHAISNGWDTKQR